MSISHIIYLFNIDVTAQPTELITWEFLNRKFEVTYGSRSKLTCPPTKDDLDSLRMFMTSNITTDELFLAKIWFQKFATYGSKPPRTSMVPTPTAPSTIQKNPKIMTDSTVELMAKNYQRKFDELYAVDDTSKNR